MHPAGHSRLLDDVAIPRTDHEAPAEKTLVESPSPLQILHAKLEEGQLSLSAVGLARSSRWLVETEARTLIILAACEAPEARDRVGIIA